MKIGLLRGERVMAAKGTIRILLFLLFMLPVGAYALGLGEIKLRSALEEPFDAEIELSSVKESVLKSLQVKLASSEDFARVGIKPVPAVKLLHFEVVRKPGGGAAIHITTQEPIHDPYLNFMVEANWGRGRVLREYTVLLDPPELAGEESPVIEAPAITPAEPPAVAGAPEVEPPPVAAVVAEPEVPPVTAADGGDEEVIEPEPLPPVDDEGLIEPQAAEPESLPDVAEPGILEPETETTTEAEALPPVDDEGLIEPQAAEPEVVEPEPLPEEAPSQPEVAETEPVDATPEDGSTEVEGVIVGSESAAVEEGSPLTYSVERGDTLWSIAERMRGDRPVTVYQVMMALFHNNPGAFIDDNVNNLKAGSVLRLEDEGELTAVSKSTARNEFWQQYRAWQEYKQMLAKNVVTQDDTLVEVGPEVALSEKTYSAEEVAHLPEARSATESASEGAQLKLVTPEEPAPGASATETAGTAAGEEGKTAAGTSKSITELQSMRDEVLAEIEKSAAGSAQNQALREKLAALEEQIASLQRVVSVKDNELAAMQQKTAEEVAAQPEPDVVDDAAAEQPAEEGGIMATLNRSPQLMGTLGGVILLLLAWLWLMFRRRNDEDETVAAAATGSGVASLADDEQGVFPEGGQSEEEILSRADAYVNEGKHAAAAELLSEAIQREPGNEAYRYRLLEIHYEMKNKDGFAREAEELYSMTGGSDTVRWGKVAAMGAALLPAHALFSGDSPASFDLEDTSDAAAARVEESVPSEWDEIDLDAELGAHPLEEEREESDQLMGEVSGETETAEAEADEESGGETAAAADSWDVDFDIDDGDETSETFLMEEEILDDAKSSGSDSEDSIDFNLSGDMGANVAATAGAAAVAGAAGAEVLEFARPDEVAEEPEAKQGEDEQQLTADEHLEASAEENIGSGPAGPDEDSLALDDELEEDGESPFPSFSEYDAMAEDDELLDDVDEIGTKLDLARAYIDMGDADAARTMLDEVKADGDEAQQQEASELLEQISS